ncbi:hypothetical protein OGAPHI_004318 [Ogataea philodendri]|uniref:non-specific serine/threonine protein kinase n=1 Tax=Ogataea philodendri TaxID=1378263 RepID=A0A9P8P709_9ASCO|nr:uncharacterized protein OGAPHI_004318 [Ogataea philodendri]KAH3666129.1 hypothetical protein OGAPHI_004318 [Ogataea philodendri]
MSALQHQRSGSTSSSQQVNRNIIASHYQIAQKIGEGSFGIIFKGHDLLRDNQPVAIKFESRKSEAPQLKDEFKAYKILNNAINNYVRDGPENDNHHYLSIEGIPKVYYFGQEGYYNILIIQLLGPSLEDLFEWCGRRFSIKTVAQVAKQMIERIQFVHENDLIYRDIKPDNFLIGATSTDNLIYLVDFGMIKQYRNPVTKQHIPYRERKSLSGTARYMSINTHLGREQSRRDDLESLGHVFLYFLKGELPWQGLKAPTNKMKYEKIGEKKQATSVQQLCHKLPKPFADYLLYVRNLRFEEDPNYEYLISLMDSVLHELGEVDDGQYDWMKLNGGKGWDWNKNKKTNLNGYGSNNHQAAKQHRSNKAVTGTRRESQNTTNIQNQYPQQTSKVDETSRLLSGSHNGQYDSAGGLYQQETEEIPEGVFGLFKSVFCCCF